MYPTLYHAFLDLFGLDFPFLKLLNSFGFFVALAFIIASYILKIEMKRMEKHGVFPDQKVKIVIGAGPEWTEIITNGIMGFLLGWKVIYLLVNSEKLFAHGLAQRALFTSEGYVVLGVLVGLALAGWKYYDDKKAQLPQPKEEIQLQPAHTLVGSITFVAAVAGMSGAKLFHLFENPREFVAFFTHPSLEGFISGLTIYGGIIVGSIVVLLYAKKKGLPLLNLADAAAPGMILAYGVGRMGCQVSGDGDWGIDNPAPVPNVISFLPDWLWSYDYPNNVNGMGEPMTTGTIFPGYGTHLEIPVFPTPLYETIWATLIFLVLWWMRKRILIPGVIFGAYLVLNGMERFFIEQIRVNNFVSFLGMRWTQAMAIAVVFMIGGLSFIYWRKKQHDRGA
jgi:phosphatidylglycerol:prolipoprotein diacylglycerol transferase